MRGMHKRGVALSGDLIPADATVLGFDVGMRRIGVAVGSVLNQGARAIAVVDVHDQVIDWAAVARLVREWCPAGMIVGDPMALDGGDQPIRQHAQGFARALAGRYPVPVLMVDERSSSVEAARRFAAERAAGRRRRRDAAHLDAYAAAIIIERWLHAPADAIQVMA